MRKKYISASLAALAMSVLACTAGINDRNAVVDVDAAKYESKGVAKEAEQTALTEEETQDETMSEEEILNKLNSNVNIEAKDVFKDETVYVFADPSGATTKILVSEKLKNKDGKAILTDKTDLKDIENVKGNETFTLDGNTITWQANGNDITYQGTSDKELPVTLKVSYYLDGKEMKPEEIAGKSGKVKMRFEYKNNAKVVKEINGRKEDINVPFVAVTGMMLNENFKNIAVTNGKVINQGGTNIVVGFGMPGLMDSIKATTDDFKETIEVPEFFEVEADVTNFGIDMTATVVLDGSAMNLASNLDFSDLDGMIGAISSATSQLVDGSDQLSTGVSTLLSKMGEFNTGVTTLKNGVDTLYNNSTTLVDGIGTIDASAQSISNGIATLDKGLNTPMSDEAAAQLKAQAAAAAQAKVDAGKDAIMAQAVAGVEAKFNGTDGTDGMYNVIKTQTNAKVTAMLSNQDTATAIMGAVSSDVNAYVTAKLQDTTSDEYKIRAALMSTGLSPDEAVAIISGMSTGVANTSATTTKTKIAGAITQADMGTTVADACKEAAVTAAKETAYATAIQTAGTVAGEAVVQGAEGAKQQIAAQIEAEQANGYSLVTGSQALAAGTNKINGAMPAFSSGLLSLKNGASSLQTGSGLLVDGVTTLNDGASALKDGMRKYDSQAISKIVNSYNGDVKSLVDRLEAVTKASTEYDTYTMHEDGVASSTKFIIKTSAIKAE